MIITVNIPLTNELIRGVRDTHLKYTVDLLNEEERIASGEQEEVQPKKNIVRKHYHWNDQTVND